jgi:pimeloyl-ACP methyl ester carboxylesterase
MPAKTDNQITLKDGRILAYAEYGDPQGKPVLHFHGTPSSRFEGSLPAMDDIATRLGARVMLPERPGFGLSDFKSRRTILDWPDDVIELADALNLERFAVSGISGGGPYVAACAYKIPNRLSAAAIVSGAGPLDAPGATDGMSKSDRQLLNLARKIPWLLLRPLFWYVAVQMRRNPDKAIDEFIGEMSEPDRAALAQPDVRELFIRMASAGVQQGGRGIAWEYVLFTRPWGFRLEEIRIPVYLWHGEMDMDCPIDMGRNMAKSIPDCRATFYPHEGHVSLFVNHYEELLSAIVS